MTPPSRPVRELAKCFGDYSRRRQKLTHEHGQMFIAVRRRPADRVFFLRRLASRVDDIIIVAAREQELPLLPARILRDELPDQGPVGGI